MGVTFLLYGFQLSGGWRFDDGHHLAYLETYGRALNYFYSPEVARLQSGAHFTPFNIFTYDLAHQFFSLTNPAGFYGFHLAALGISVGLLFLALRAYTSRIAAAVGATFFLLGFPTAGISGQLMVGHYVLGFSFAALFIYFYIRSPAFKPAFVLSAVFYFLACACKEIFIPLIAIPLVDPRSSLRVKVQHTVLLGLAFLIFWAVRTAMIQQAVGGYNVNVETSLLESIRLVVQGLIDYFAASLSGIVLGGFCIVTVCISVIAVWRRFGTLAAGMVMCGAIAIVIVPLLAVPYQVTPQTPVEIRLLSMFWWVLAFAAASSVAYVSTLTSNGVAVFASCALLTVSAWNTVTYVHHGELSSIEREFDAFSAYVVQKRSCHLVDAMGWSSAIDALYSAVWPNTSHRIVAPLAIIELTGMPGDSVCAFEHGSIVETGKIEQKRSCDMTEPLGVILSYDGAHITFSFSSSAPGTYYLEVPDRYFLSLPSKLTGAFPDPNRFSIFRVLKILNNGDVTCSPLLHFVPNKAETFEWHR
ncbi:MAG: hypothetical protein WC100_02735 [Sterolibacterium sp.]